MADRSVTGMDKIRNAEARVLVVDDDQDQAESLADWVRSRGYEARTASNGELALSVVTEFEPRSVVLDVHMPSMDGNELAAMLRTYFGNEVVLIGMSGYPASDPSVAAAARWVDHYFRKPVDFEALAQVLPERGPA